ncbi:MAG: choice-of-anchor D domain-containing protein [bacterium]
MKHVITLFVALFIISSLANSAEKRVLIEGYTGAWCGWCPYGAYMMDAMYEAHPGQIIGIEYHKQFNDSPSSDGMQINDGLSMYNAFKGAGGNLPTGSLDRYSWTKGILIHPAYWPDSTNVILAQSAPVDVTLVWYFNAETQKISGKITCTALMDIPYQLAFQVIVCENNVTGTGSQFDQNNSLSGNDNYKGTPYFDKPNLMVGFVHNKVARAIIGGLAGSKGNFPAVINAGETYKWDFVADMPTAPAGSPVKLADLTLVGLVGLSNTAGYVIPVLNCVEGTSGGAVNTMTVEGDPVNYIGSGQQVTYKFTINNSSQEDITYNLTLEKDALTPAGWLAQIVGGKKSVAIKKGGKAAINIDVFPSNNIGNGVYKLVAVDANDENSKLEAKVEVVHTGAERLYIYYAKDDYSKLKTLIPLSNYDKFASISAFSIGDDLAKIQAVLAKFTKAKTVVFSMADIYALTAPDINLLQAYYDAGVGILVDGTLSLSQTELQTFLKNTYGFGWSKQFKTLNTEQVMPIEGITGDAISNGFIGSLKKDKQWPSVFTITDDAKAKKTLVYKDDKTNIAAVASDIEGKKLVALGFSFANMTDDQKKLDLFNKSIYWLEKGISSIDLRLDVDKTEINYGDLTVESAKDTMLTISNAGSDDITLEEINISGTNPEGFSFEVTGIPKVIHPAESFYVTVRFAPTVAKPYAAKLNILSNSVKYPEISVNLLGNGTANSVRTDAGFICSISMSPNPVTSSSEITYIVTGLVNAVIRISDAQGRVVAEIYNGLLNAGSYDYSLNTRDLSSGNYFITSEFDGKSETLPFVVVK